MLKFLISSDFKRIFFFTRWSYVEYTVFQIILKSDLVTVY